MTIAAVSDGTDVWMGCDSSPGYRSDNAAAVQANRKVLRLGRALVGTNNARLSQLIEYDIEPTGPDEGQDPVAWVVKSLIPALEPAYTDADIYMGEPILIGVDGKLFVVGTDKGVSAVLQSYASVGSGRDAWISLGALAAMPDEPPADRVEMALWITEDLGSETRSPFYVEATGDTGEGEEDNED